MGDSGSNNDRQVLCYTQVLDCCKSGWCLTCQCGKAAREWAVFTANEAQALGQHLHDPRYLGLNHAKAAEALVTHALRTFLHIDPWPKDFEAAMVNAVGPVWEGSKGGSLSMCMHRTNQTTSAGGYQMRKRCQKCQGWKIQGI